MSDYDDAELIREADGQADADASRSEEGDARGANVVVGITATDGSYPATANVFYKVNPQIITGTEVEGGAGTLTADGAPIYAYNRGTGIPPVGTKVECRKVPARYTFRYDS